jgi:hypothetical protein
VKGSYAEPWVDTSALAPVAHTELQALARLVGADDLRIDERGNLARALRLVDGFSSS